MPTEKREGAAPMSASTPILAEFADRDQVDRVVEALAKSGFSTDQFSIVSRGAGEHDGVFQPGAIMLTLRAGDREAEAVRILRAAKPRALRHGLLSVTGDVLEESELEEPAGR